ncbi:MAG: 50S ribosomal protein L6 [Candidatus Omnitrophica bacterium]|nr:50S ribosomal protein L6 [Candidatus Omnitrophota bacterium]
MSRKGKIPIQLVKDAKIFVEKSSVRVEGPKGKLTVDLPSGISVEQKDDHVLVNRKGDLKQSKANHGTIRSLLVNMIEGVTKGHKKELQITGVGFRAQATGGKLVLNIGFSHPIEYAIPQDVKVATPAPTQISIEGVDKSLVGRVAAEIRDFKRPEPYKGKGIAYVGEVIRRKQGKSVTK